MFNRKSFLIGLVITLLLFFFAAAFTNSEIYISRLDGINNCIKDGQIPCRWVPVLDNFYGSPIFNYLPPLPYYFGETILLIGGSPAFAVNVIFFVGLLGSYIFMYLLAKGMLPVSYAFISFLALLFFEGGLGLVWGLMISPLAIMSLEKFFRKRNINNFLFFSIMLSLLLLSSNIGLMLIGVFFLWIVIRYLKDNNLVFFAICLSSIIFTLLLSAFYIFPALLERDLLSRTSGFNYLPKSVEEKPKDNIYSTYEILTGNSVISNFKQGSDWLKFNTDTKTHSIIRLSQLYFPRWKIFIDGKEVKVEYKNNSLGLMTIIIGEGYHSVEGRLFDTPVRSVSNMITVVSAILAFLLLLSQLKIVNCGINYYRKRMN